MLQQSFIFLERISRASEQNIWKHAHDWDSFASRDKIPGISDVRKAYYERRLKTAQTALEERNAAHFAQGMPLSETWRLFNDFKDQAVYLDIETTHYRNDITVIGLSDGTTFKPLVRGFNLDREILLAALQNAKLLITFNGASFDVPAIEHYFATRLPPIAHIDLRHVCAKIGLCGGLKSIEREIGIERPEEAQGVSGLDAIWLWQQFQYSKDPAVLQKLIAYNQADVENMKTLAEFAIPRLWNMTRNGTG